MPKYRVVALCGITVITDVEASSPKQAKELAEERSMMTLCFQCASGNSDEEWVTSGELDGVPRELTTELLDGDNDV